jgi:phosphoinositide-3-kinase regulatory subunit 4
MDSISAPVRTERCAREKGMLFPSASNECSNSKQIAHGDIKAENVLVASHNWIYLTDFASFKPVYLPEDDPSDFSFFFDTSGRRTCYLAPERFYASGSEIEKRKAELEFGKRDGKITEAMDVFGLGCVIAELFSEGNPPFTLSQLLRYRSGQHSPDAYLDAIEDSGIRVRSTRGAMCFELMQDTVGHGSKHDLTFPR